MQQRKDGEEENRTCIIRDDKTKPSPSDAGVAWSAMARDGVIFCERQTPLMNPPATTNLSYITRHS